MRENLSSVRAFLKEFRATRPTILLFWEGSMRTAFNAPTLFVNKRGWVCSFCVKTLWTYLVVVRGLEECVTPNTSTTIVHTHKKFPLCYFTFLV